MSAGAQVVTTQSSELPTPVDQPADALARVLDEIRADAARAPEAYVREALVPKGGE
jgi:hypothetical protein